MNKPSTLTSLFSFWVVLLFFPFWSFLLSYYLFKNGNYLETITPESLEKFYNDFKIPFLLLACAIPSAGFYAAIFRSQQTAEQIALTNVNNIFNNHFKHFEHFENFIKKRISNFESIYTISIEKLHKIAYPNTTSGDFSPNRKFIEIDSDINLALNNVAYPITFDICKISDLESNHKVQEVFRKKTGLSVGENVSFDNFYNLISTINDSAAFFGEKDLISVMVKQRIAAVAGEYLMIKRHCEGRQLSDAMSIVFNQKALKSVRGYELCSLLGGIEESICAILWTYPDTDIRSYISRLKEADPLRYNEIITAIDNCEIESRKTGTNIDKLLKLKDL